MGSDVKSVGIPRFQTLDHIIPRILGGSNRQDNLQLLCIACHRIKDVSSGYWKNKSDMYKMLNIGFILDYDGFASIIVTHVLDKKLNVTSAIEKKRRRGQDRRCNIAPCAVSTSATVVITSYIIFIVRPTLI
jgi:hypothetical protein